MSEPVSTPIASAPEPEKMIPLSAVAPLLLAVQGWIDDPVLAGAKRNIHRGYDYAAERLGLPSVKDIHDQYSDSQIPFAIRCIQRQMNQSDTAVKKG